MLLTPYVTLVSAKKVAGKYAARYSASSTSKAKFFALLSFSGIENSRKLLSELIDGRTTVQEKKLLHTILPSIPHKKK